MFTPAQHTSFGSGFYTIINIYLLKWCFFLAVPQDNTDGIHGCETAIRSEANRKFGKEDISQIGGAEGHLGIYLFLTRGQKMEYFLLQDLILTFHFIMKSKIQKFLFKPRQLALSWAWK